jgi:hypothetical protein
MNHPPKRDDETILEYLKKGMDEEFAHLKTLPKNQISDVCKKMLSACRHLWKDGIFQYDQEAIIDGLERQFRETGTEYEKTLIDLFCVRLNYLEVKEIQCQESHV